MLLTLWPPLSLPLPLGLSLLVVDPPNPAVAELVPYLPGFRVYLRILHEQHHAQQYLQYPRYAISTHVPQVPKRKQHTADRSPSSSLRSSPCTRAGPLARIVVRLVSRTPPKLPLTEGLKKRWSLAKARKRLREDSMAHGTRPGRFGVVQGGTRAVSRKQSVSIHTGIRKPGECADRRRVIHTRAAR